jgi:hypothetical protein
MLRFVGLVLALATVLVPAGQAFDAAPRLAYDQEASKMNVAWSVPAGSKEQALEYGPTRELGLNTVPKVDEVEGLSVWPTQAQMQNLEPGTTYHYRIVIDGVRDEIRSFTTAPLASQGFSFVAWGDQSSPGAPEAVGDAPRLVTELARAQEPAFGLVMGDLSYAGSEEDWWNQYVEQASGFAATRPFMTVPGNHDFDGFGPPGYRSRFNMPTVGSGDWYAFRHWNTLFVGLDTESFCEEDETTRGRAPFGDAECPRGPNKEQLEFLRSTLGQARQDPSIRFIVVYHHFGAHSQGKHGGNALIREHWVPLYDEFRVDLVLQAHDHLYLRSLPMRNGSVDPNGTTYVVAGTGGAKLYPHGAKQAWEAAFDDQHHGLVRIKVSSRMLEGEFLTTSGEVKDQFVIARSFPLAEDESIPFVSSPGLATLLLPMLASLVLMRRRG